MRKLENINWESERELVIVNDLDNQAIEDDYTEENWNVSFEYNGHKLTSVIDFVLSLKEFDEEETNTHDIDVVSVDVTIKQLLDEYEEVFELTAKDEIELQNILATELKTEF
jgi:hypothetical protein